MTTLAWTLDWAYGGRVWRLASQSVEVPPADPLDGLSAVPYQSGLSVGDAEESLPLFEAVPGSRAVAVEIEPVSGLDVGALTAAGHYPPESWADLRLMSIDDDGTAECLYRVRGRAAECGHGGADEPITLTVEEAEADDAGTLIPDACRITEETWPDRDENVDGTWYPLVVGRPGSSEWTGANRRGSPVYPVDVSGVIVNIVYLIAGHHVEATSVHLYCESTGGAVDLAPTNGVDGLGNPVATVTDAGNALGWTSDGIEVWASWDAGNGLGTRRLGEVVRWALGLSTLAVDWTDITPTLAWLDTLGAVDTPITTDGDRLAPLAWLTDQVLPVCPVSAAWTERGYTLVPWRSGLTDADAVARLTAQSVGDDGRLSAGAVARIGPVEWTPTKDGANDIGISFAYNQPRNLYHARLRATGELRDLETDTGTSLSLRLRRSMASYGRRRKDLETQSVWEAATAGMWLAWRSDFDAHPARAVEIEGGTDLVRIRLGDPVTLTDASIGWAAEVGTVVGRKLPESGAIVLRIRVETP